MISKRKLADGRFAYTVRVGHGSPARTVYRYADAVELESQIRRDRARADAGMDEVKPNVTLNELAQLWAANFSPSPWREAMLSYSLSRWGKVRVRDIKPEALGAWIATVEGKNGPLSEKSRAHVLETLRRVLNAGVEWGYLTRSPARPGAFRAPSKSARVDEIRPFESWDEVLRVSEACRYGTAPQLVRFVCATGLRIPNEVFALTWADVDIGGGVIRVGSKTAAGHRTVPLSVNATAALADVPRRIDGGVIFTGRKGRPFDYEGWRRGDWRRALGLCGLPHRPPYQMRHTFATLALTAGASIDDVATVMGHEDITVAFRHYRKWTRGMADRLRATLDQIGDEHERESVPHSRGG